MGPVWACSVSLSRGSEREPSQGSRVIAEALLRENVTAGKRAAIGKRARPRMIRCSPCKLLLLAAVAVAVASCALKPAENDQRTVSRDNDCTAADPLHRVSSSTPKPDVDPEIDSLLAQETDQARLRQINRRMYQSLYALDVELRREQAIAVCKQPALDSTILEVQSTKTNVSGGAGSRSAAAAGAAPQSSLAAAGGRKASVSSTGAAGNGATAPKIAPGSDNDIVARRLRKAAEGEADPTLRAKLWKEYTDYRQGTAVAK